MDTSFRSVYIENFQLNTSPRVLEKLFSKFGPLKHLDMPTFEPEHPLCRGLPKPKAKGFAFIEFTKKSDADLACRFFNNLDFIKIAAKLQEGESVPALDEMSFEDPPLVGSVLMNLEFRRLLLLRVMPKKEFQQLSDSYNDKKLNSLIRAARLLVVS